MRTGRTGWLGVILALGFTVLSGISTPAEDITFNVKVVNPLRVEDVVKVRKDLPRGIDPKTDVVEKGEFDIRYDARKASHYVYVEARLAAGETRTYSITLKDIWTIPAAQLAKLRTHALQLADPLSETKSEEASAAVKERIQEILAKLDEREKMYGLTTADVQEHIQAHRESSELLDAAIVEVGELERMAVGEGIDPGELYGPLPPLPDEGRELYANYVGEEPVVFMVEIKNAASSEQTVPLRRYLPKEVLLSDIDPGDDLQAGYDADRGACFVFSREVTIPAKDSLVFNISVSNRWMVAPARFEMLISKATNLQARAEVGMEYAQKQAASIIAQLIAAQEQELPNVLDAQYIAFYHARVRELDEIERRILRLQEMLEPKKRRKVFKAEMLENVEAPSRSSTWIIIYIILGFMALVSILFFLRWYGKGPDEKMINEDEPSEGVGNGT